MHNEETYIYFPPMKQRYPSSTHPNVNVHQLSKFEEEEGGNEERRRRHRKEMGGGGTEAFPDLGKHCDQEDCKQLDFLPFVCDGCQKVFCLEHRTYKAHACRNAEHNSRVVVVCDVCAASLEKKAGEEEKDILERHAESGSCDPGRKNKPRCPVKRCKEVLTFSNSSTCKTCRQKVCLKHRFPSDHACGASRAAGLPVRLPARSGIGCRDNKSGRMPTSPSVKAC